MRSDVTQSEIDFYQDNGFLVVEEFLDDQELAHWREVVDNAVNERRDLRIPEIQARDIAESDADNPAVYYQKVFTQRVNLWKTSDETKKLILDERIGRVVTHLAGTEGMRIWHDQALIKEPYANPTGFHLDVPYWSFSSPDAISIWIALDDATPYNGCLCYIPGSHKARKFDNVGIGKELDALFKIYPEWKDVQPVFCPVKAGSAVFHNGLTAHGAGANMTPGRRRAMTAGFMPIGSKFNGTQNVLPPDYFSSLAVGDELANDEQNPVVYREVAHV